MKLLEFADTLRRLPPQSQRSLSERLGLQQKSVWSFLKQLEVREFKGRDPISGRNGTKLYELMLPKEKAKALR